MSGEAWLYLLSVLINAVNLFLQVFFTIMYSDLEWYVHNYVVRTKVGETAAHYVNVVTISILSTYVTDSIPTLYPKPLSMLSSRRCSS